LWFCHRNIVILKTRHGSSPFKRRRKGADVTIQDAPPAFVRQVDSLLSARNLPAPTLAGGSLRRAIRRADDPPRRYPRKPRAVA
jgi:hypothetical protein